MTYCLIQLPSLLNHWVQRLEYSSAGLYSAIVPLRLRRISATQIEVSVEISLIFMNALMMNHYILTGDHNCIGKILNQATNGWRLIASRIGWWFYPRIISFVE